MRRRIVKSRNILSLSLSIFIGALLLTGCPPKKKMEIEEKPKEEAQATPEATPIPSENDVKISQDWAEIAGLSLVHFDYDSAQVKKDELQILKQNVAVIKKLPKSVTVRVEGHCDDRGTVEYNIALGQKRADAVRAFYVTAGIPKSRIKTISFGEERPLCTSADDACWAQNRRGVTTVRNDEPLSIKPESLQ